MNISTTPFQTGRRAFLRNTTMGAGGMLLGGMLDRIALGAQGRAAAPRFLFVVEGNGCPAIHLHPRKLPFLEDKKREELEVHQLRDLQLSKPMEPVEKYKDRMAIVQGLSGKRFNGSHSADQGALGAYFANAGRNLSARTIDCELGHLHPGAIRFATLGLSANQRHRIIYNCSVADPGLAVPTILDPMQGFQRLFGSVASGEAANHFKVKRHLLDYMRDDIRRSRREMGGADREKLDAYLSAYEELHGESDRLLELRDELARVAPSPSDKYSSGVETDVLDSHFEMATAALIGGLTNSMTIASGVGFKALSVTYKGLGVEMNKHKIGHEDQEGELAMRIRRYHFELIARTMDRLASVPEGDGTMLDNTLIVYLSDAASAHHGGFEEWPLVLMGGCNGKLRTDGRYVVYPYHGKPGHRTLNTLYNSILHAAGGPRDDFGDPDPDLDESMSRGTLDEILA